MREYDVVVKEWLLGKKKEWLLDSDSPGLNTTLLHSGRMNLAKLSNFPEAQFLP